MSEALAKLALQIMHAQGLHMWGLGRDPNQGTAISTILWNTFPPRVVKSPGGPGDPDGGDDLSQSVRWQPGFFSDGLRPQVQLCWPGVRLPGPRGS